MFISLLIAGGLAAAPPVADAWDQFEGHPQAILIQERSSFIICVGVCTDSDLMVDSSGLVLFRVRMAGSGTKSFRYRVSPEQVKAFWKTYAPLRPKGLKGVEGDCNSQGHLPIIDWDIRWQDSAGDSRLLACTGAKDAAKTWYEGFHILRISPVTGERLTAEQAEFLARP